MPRDRPRVEAFFESYRQAFGQRDAAAIARHYAYPCHITAEDGAIHLISVATAEAWRRRVADFLTLYDAVGVAYGHIVDLHVTDLSDRLRLALARWEARRRRNGALQLRGDVHARGDRRTPTGHRRRHNELPALKESWRGDHCPHRVIATF